MIFASFLYRGHRLDIVAVGRSLAPTIRCPGCLTRYRLNPQHHAITIGSAGLVSIAKPILCRNPLCGWHVRISRGKAVDLLEDGTVVATVLRISVSRVAARGFRA